MISHVGSKGELREICLFILKDGGKSNTALMVIEWRQTPPASRSLLHFLFAAPTIPLQVNLLAGGIDCHFSTYICHS